MNNQNLLYAFIGGFVVALAWLASVSLTLEAAVIAIGVYSIAAIVALVFLDYRHQDAKALK